MKRFRAMFVTLALLGVFFPDLAHGQALPDLTISLGPSGLAEVINDQRDTIAVTVRNDGVDTTRASIDIAVYLSVDTAPQASEKVGVDLLVQALPPGDSVVVRVPVRVPALLALGSYFWLAQVDVLGGVSESDETNNLIVGHPVQVVAPPADLAVTTAPVGPAEATLNGSYTVSLNIENLGDGPNQSGFDVAIFLSTDGVLDSADVEVGRSSIVNTLSAGIPWPVQVTTAIPSSMVLGNYVWLAVLDAGGAVTESDETNNSSAGNAVAVVNKLADFIVSSPPVGPNGVYRRGNYVVSTEISNQGTGSNTRVFDVVVYLSEDLIVGNEDDVRVGDIAIRDVLEVGASQTVEVPVIISALQGLRAYHWVAVVDAVGFVAELSEDNNALIGQAVSVVPSPPDLIADNVQAPAQVQRNGVYPLALDVLNAGDGPTTGAFQVSFFLSSDDSIGNGDDVRVGTTTFTDVLAVGARSTLSALITVPSSQPFGVYRLIAIVDAAGVEAESNEGNNALITDPVVHVVTAPPDLLFVTDPAGDARIFRGVLDSVTVQIRNQGAGDVSGAFDVFVFLSVDSEAGDDDTLVGTLKIETPIASGDALTVEVPIFVPVDQRLGTYRWWAQLDANDALDESDENNNVRVGVAVSVVHFPADLVISDEFDAPSQVARGGVYAISVPVRNAGSGPAESGFQVEVFLSTDQVLDDEDVIAGGRKFPEALAAGDERIVSVSVAVPIEQPAADYRWIARVSAVGLQDESNIENNIRLGNSVSFPVLTIEPDSLNFGLVRVGESKSLAFEVRNGGTARLSFEIESPDPQITTKPQSVTDLPPGIRWPITVTYAPRENGELDAVLRLNSNDPDGDGVVLLQGLGRTPETDRMALDLDPGDGNQQKTTRNTYALQRVPFEVFVSNLPQIMSATILVEFDAQRLAFVADSWVPDGLFAGASDFSATSLAPGLLALEASDAQTIGPGSGALGQILFETLPALRDSTEDGQGARVRVIQMQYILPTGQEDSVQIQAETTLVYDPVCWADFDADGQVALGDFLLFKDAFEKRESDLGWAEELDEAPQTPYRRFDGNGDGIVNLSDFVLLTQVFGQSCSP